MPFGQGDQPIQTLPPEGPDEPFAKRIGLRAPHGRLAHLKAEVCYRRIAAGGEDRVAVMEDKPVRVVGRDCLTQLLEGPDGSRMGGHVEVNDSVNDSA